VETNVVDMVAFPSNFRSAEVSDFCTEFGDLFSGCAFGCKCGDVRFQGQARLGHLANGGAVELAEFCKRSTMWGNRNKRSYTMNALEGSKCCEMNDAFAQARPTDA
jgi:hypothetical protein